MVSQPPSTLKQAVAAGLALLDDDSKRELALLTHVDPHTKYRADFIALVGEELGIFNRSNQLLLEDVAKDHVDQLHFLELIPDMLAQATVRIILVAMAEELRLV